MSRAGEAGNSIAVNQLMAGVSKTIVDVRYCWLVTEAETGPNARPMGRLFPVPEGTDWTLRFIADRRSRKASNIRCTDKVSILLQGTDDAFVALIGRARLQENASETRGLWHEAYNTYFSSDAERENAAFIEVDVKRMELWIRGLSPEPFGLRPSVLERGANGVWRLNCGDRNAV